MLLKKPYPVYLQSGLSIRLRQACLRHVENILGLRPGQCVLEAGCVRGIDFAQFAFDNYSFINVEIADVHLVCDFRLQQLDAKSLSRADNYFEALVSIGILKHIQPIDVLCEVTSEIRRISKRFCVIVPPVGTWLEPHTWSPFWQAGDRLKKMPYDFKLNDFSDEAWLQLPGFVDAQTKRYWHAPEVQNLMILAPESECSSTLCLEANTAFGL